MRLISSVCVLPQGYSSERLAISFVIVVWSPFSVSRDISDRNAIDLTFGNLAELCLVGESPQGCVRIALPNPSVVESRRSLKLGNPYERRCDCADNDLLVSGIVGLLESVIPTSGAGSNGLG